MRFPACFISNDSQSAKMAARPFAAHGLAKNWVFHQPVGAPFASALVALLAVACAAGSAADNPPARYGYRVISEYAHDPQAFTQGLVYYRGFLYESTGGYGASSIRKV